MSGLLDSEERFEIVRSMDEADLVIVNSCTVKNPSQDSFLTFIKIFFIFWKNFSFVK